MMNKHLIMYGHQFCPDVFFLRRALDQNGVIYEWRDVAEGDPAFKHELRLLARGNLSVPTLVLPDGQVLVEPNPREVFSRLKDRA
jgi:mycoredoxin